MVLDVAGFMDSIGAESIDRLPLNRAQHAAKKADYFLYDRGIVVEVKRLVDNRESRVQEVANRWRNRPGWPLVYGTLPFQLIIDRHPCRDQINRELFHAVMDSVEGAFELANRQIRETRRAFNVPEAAHGMLLLVNETVWFFNPDAVRFELCRLWAKRHKGDARFAHVDWTVMLTTAHAVVDGQSKEYVPVLSLSAPYHERDGVFEALEDRFLRDWAAYLRLPYQPSTAGALKTARVIAKAKEPELGE